MGRLYNELLEQSKKIRANFCVPGHKTGHGITALDGGRLFDVDLTELDGTDNLGHPRGILRDAQERAAAVFGAERTFFLLGGSTIGLEAAILGATQRGDKILVDRCAHRSVISAMVLGGLEPVFVEPRFKAQSGVYAGMTKADVSAALAENGAAVGMVLTSPSYYGICSDIRGIADALHDAGEFLIVDEAHGAHFKFDKRLPKTALECGADAAVQSAHKTLPCPTQASLLHIGKNSRLDTDRVFERLKLLQTTSPSYALMAALDNSISEMADGRFSALIDALERFPEKLGGKVGMLKNDDITRPVFDMQKLRQTGAEAEAELRESFGIYAEMADNRYVVCVATVGTRAEELDLLAEGLNSLKIKNQRCPRNKPLPKVEMGAPPYLAFDAPTFEVKSENAVGHICGEIVSACPPGSAILIPGQIVSEEAAARLAGQTLRVI